MTTPATTPAPTPTEPPAELDPRYSSPGAEPPAWPTARDRLQTAPTLLLCTVRPDGRPHATPLLSVWLDDALWFCTGPDEQKARNLAHGAACLLTAADCTSDRALDVVVEGDAERVRDDALLRRVADAYVARHGEEWRFEVRDGGFHQGDPDATPALVFRVAPRTVRAFVKGEPYSQTRWRFAAPAAASGQGG
ncbi:MAG: pyridoxamine 5'-phosphate oxidase family protein [Cellulomonas sp.]|uniref:pyridoxamine 5'-phosphate oxidase family protein n=1 Tax=Cellulomonas sp. TaxID=40001 RepID=UPI001A0E2D36|nr:pyridoxamine 5'-phosphate oxidase family protein [Cellulomonas sp.]MBF0688665.1 pyridoxamine 5'-phosphate oxidase family protein [Cellulomonas sp.]